MIHVRYHCYLYPQRGEIHKKILYPNLSLTSVLSDLASFITFRKILHQEFCMTYLNNRDIILTNISSQSQSESAYCYFHELGNIYHWKLLKMAVNPKKIFCCHWRHFSKQQIFNFCGRLKVLFTKPFNFLGFVYALYFDA